MQGNPHHPQHYPNDNGVRQNAQVKEAGGGTSQLGGGSMAAIMGGGGRGGGNRRNDAPVGGTGRLGGGGMAAIMGGGDSVRSRVGERARHGDPLHFRSGLNSLYGPPPSTAEINSEKSKSQQYAEELRKQVAEKAERKRREKMKEQEYDRKMLEQQQQHQHQPPPPGRFKKPNLFGAPAPGINGFGGGAPAAQPQGDMSYGGGGNTYGGPSPYQPAMERGAPTGMMMPPAPGHSQFGGFNGPTPGGGFPSGPPQGGMNVGNNTNHTLFGQSAPPMAVSNSSTNDSAVGGGGGGSGSNVNSDSTVPYWKQEQLAQQDAKRKAEDDRQAKLAAIKVCHLYCHSRKPKQFFYRVEKFNFRVFPQKNNKALRTIVFSVTRPRMTDFAWSAKPPKRRKKRRNVSAKERKRRSLLENV